MNKIYLSLSVLSLLFSHAVVMTGQENAVKPTEQKVTEKTEQPATQNADQPAAEKPAPPTEAEIIQWIKQLDSEMFVERETAVIELTKAGLPAIPKVAEAAESESLEVSTRAFEILEKWISGENQISKLGAKAALEKISAGDEKSKAVRRSKALLAKNKAPQYQDPSGRPAIARAMPLRVAVAPARVELRAMAQMAVGVRGRSMRVTIADGKKTIHVTEGDNLEVNIVEGDDTGIQIKVTEKDKEGKEKKSEYAAKSLEELKEKQPEGHKIYEKYAGALAGIKIKMEAARARAVPEPVKKPEVKKLEEKDQPKLLPAEDPFEGNDKPAEKTKPSDDPF